MAPMSGRPNSVTPTDPAAIGQRGQLARAAAQLGISLGDLELDRLLAFLALMQRWNRVYNLTAVRDPSEMLGLHLVDCLAILPALARHAGGRRLNVLDVGSGGGLPGVVIAALRPEWSVTCVDTVAKKSSFIRQVGAELGLRNLQAVHARVEAMPGTGIHDVITSRAFASLTDFVTLTRKQLAPGGVWLAMKGRRPDDEVAALPADIEVFHVEPLQVPELDAQRCLVWMRPRAG